MEKQEAKGGRTFQCRSRIFRGMAKGICELLLIKRLLTELGFAPTLEMDIFCDNKVIITIAHNPVQHDRTKHMEVDRHFIKENLEGKIIQFAFVKSKDQLADVLTKAISSKEFNTHLTSCTSETCMHQLEGECWCEL
jgi:hypothetical protein